MKHFFHKGVSLFLLLFSLSASAQRWQDTVRSIEALFARYKPGNPGCELAISRNGQVIFSKAWGLADLEHHVPMTTTSITEAGSVSKQITAAAILLLEQQGKLSLNDDVRKYIPELPDYGQPILLRYLMHHTSGLRDWGSVAALSGWPRTTKTYSNEDALDIIIHQHRLNNPPNALFIYSNTNYNLLATIVTRVSGMSLKDFTREYIFKPAGMNHTTWRDDHKRVVPDRAIAYSIRQGVYQTEMPNEDVYGHGGMLTTAEDLLKWNAYYLSGRFGTPPLLTRQLTTDSLSNGQVNNYAAGLFISQMHGLSYVSHDGATAGYRAFLSSYPDRQLSVAWVSNTSAFDTARAIGKSVEDIFFGGTATSNRTTDNTPAARPPVIPEEKLRAYAGKYYSEEVQAGFTVLVKDGQLCLYRAPQTTIPLTPQQNGHFITTDPAFAGEKGDVFFLPGNDGSIKDMLISTSRAFNVDFTKTGQD